MCLYRKILILYSQLVRYESGIGAPLRHEVLMRPLLYKVTLIDNSNGICIFNCRQTMSNHDCSATTH